MLEKVENARERWGGVSSIIDAWLDERQKLIKVFVSIPKAKIGDELNARLDRFCSLLMDYLSSGHFEVYEQLLREGQANNEDSVESAREILPRIQDSTDIALDFNDDYTAFQEPTFADIRECSHRLSALGEALEERFGLEDQLIKLLHEVRQEDATES